MSLSFIPVGSVLTKVYYAVPDHYTTGEKFDDHTAACEYAKRQWARQQEGTEIPIRPPVIDLWWVMRPPSGPEQDVRVDRIALGEGARPAIFVKDLADPEFHS